MHIQRRKTRAVQVGSVAVGGEAPIAIQSMTNTLTQDVDATVRQIRRLAAAGARDRPRGGADAEGHRGPEGHFAAGPRAHRGRRAFPLRPGPGGHRGRACTRSA